MVYKCQLNPQYPKNISNLDDIVIKISHDARTNKTEFGLDL